MPDLNRCTVAVSGPFDEDLALRSWREDTPGDLEWFCQHPSEIKRVRMPTALERRAFNMADDAWTEVFLLDDGETTRWFMGPKR